MHKQLVLAEQNTQLQFEGGLYHPPLWNEHDSPWFISLRRHDHITDVKISKNFVFIPNSLNLFFYSLVPKGELFSLTRPFCFSSFFKFTCLHHNYLFYMHMFANCLCFFFFLANQTKPCRKPGTHQQSMSFNPECGAESQPADRWLHRWTLYAAQHLWEHTWIPHAWHGSPRTRAEMLFCSLQKQGRKTPSAK